MIVLLLLLCLAIVARSQDLVHKCYTPFPEPLKNPHENLYSINFTAYDNVSLLVYEHDEIVFKHTNIPRGLIPYVDADLRNLTTKNSNPNKELFRILEDVSVDSKNYRLFDVKYDGVVRGEKEERRFNHTIMNKYLKKGESTYFRVPFSSIYCILYYDHHNNYDEILLNKGEQTLKIQEYQEFNGLGITELISFSSSIIAVIFEIILVVFIKKQVNQYNHSNSQKDNTITAVPFKFMVNLLLLEILRNFRLIILLSVLSFDEKELYKYTLEKIGFVTYLIFNTWTMVVLYEFVTFSHAVLSPIQWDFKKLINCRCLAAIIILKLLVYTPTNPLYKFLMINKILGRTIDFVFIVLLFIQSQKTQAAYLESNKKYSRCLKFSRIFITPSLLTYKFFGKLISLFLKHLLFEIVRAFNIDILEEEIIENSIALDILFFFIDPILDSFYMNEKFLTPIMIILMFFIWKPLLALEPETENEQESVEMEDHYNPHEAFLE